MSKEIDEDIEALKNEVQKDRKELGPYPLNISDEKKWERMCQHNRDLAKSLNNKINTYNLIVPLLNKQKFHVDVEAIFEDVLKNGEFLDAQTSASIDVQAPAHKTVPGGVDEIFVVFLKTLIDLLSLKKGK